MATQMKPNLELSSLLRDIRPGDDRTLERIAKLAAACRVAVAYGDLSGLEGLR